MPTNWTNQKKWTRFQKVLPTKTEFKKQTNLNTLITTSKIESVKNNNKILQRSRTRWLHSQN